MVEILPHTTECERAWTMRDDIQRHFFGDIPETARKVTLSLSWKPDIHRSKVLVGCFRVDLPALIDEGYARRSARGFRLRFQREGVLIQIACNRSSPALTVGSIDAILIPHRKA